MSRRYFFWRKPNGHPARDQDNKYALAEILAEYGRKSEVIGHSIRWPALANHECDTALRAGSVILSNEEEELNDADSWKIVFNALLDSIRKTGSHKPVSPDVFSAEVDAKAAEFYRLPQRPYELISSLSVAEFPCKYIRLGDCRISPIKSRINYPQPKHLRQYKDLVGHIESSKYQAIKVETKGRSLQEASTRGLNAIHILRGLWSLFAKHRSWSISLGGYRSSPIGDIHAGPVHILYEPDGNLAGEIFWGEFAWRKDGDLFTLKPEEWKIVEGNRRWALRRLEKLKYRQDLNQLLIRYAIGLSQNDHDVAFLQLWSILEKITDSIGSYDETVRRAIWPFEDRKLAKELLESMRSRRNLFVHGAQAGEDPDQAAYLVKSFVDVHLLRLIRNSLHADRLEEYARNLGLPRDVEQLKREKTLLSRVIRQLNSRDMPAA